MKLLHIEETYRLWLNKKKAIGFDGDLNEVLAGLTHDESVFYVDNADHLTLRMPELSADDLSRFVALYYRHISAPPFIEGP